MKALAIIVAAMLISAGAFTAREMWTAYLSAFMFCAQASLGAFALLCIHNLTGGRWGQLIRPFLLWSLPTIGLLFILFIPLIFGEKSIYPWADPFQLAHNTVLAQRTWLMNVPFFSARGCFYLGLWCVLAFVVDRHSRGTGPVRLLSGLTLMVLLFTVSLAAMDWIMTVDREYSATGFGALAITGALSNGIAFVILMTVLKARRLAMVPQGNTEELPLLNDLGNLLLMSVMLWCYLDFTQFLINWSGQLPREMRWYEARSQGPWLPCMLVILFLHFIFPFTLLLFRRVKNSPVGMATLAISVLVGQALENLEWTAPSVGLEFSRALAALLVALIAFGTLWITVVARKSRREPPETMRQMALAVEA